MKKHVLLMGLAVLLFGTLWLVGAQATSVVERNVSEVPKAFGVPPAPEPLSPPPPCPATFANCNDVPGRNCNFSTQCTTTDTTNKHCRLPDGSVFNCAGQQTIQVQTCPCREVFHLVCCDDDSCGFECGDCLAQPGRQIFFCA